MSEVTVLPAVKRERAGKGAARAVRREGLVPGVIYGKKEDPILFQMDPRPLLKAMHRPGFFSTVFKIDVKGAREYTVLAKDVQLHPVSDQPIHVDMLRFDKDAKITVGVSVRFVNDDICPGIKKGGVLNVVRHEVEVVCSPTNIPTEFVIDLAQNEIGDSIHVSVLNLPEGVTPTITDRDFTIATIAAPTVARETAAEEAEAQEEGEAE